MTEPAIQIRNLRFAYGRREVLRGLDLDVPAGSIFGFLGRNGAGKTTTIKLLLGLFKPGAGACTVLGRDAAADALQVRRLVGYMAEDQQMYPWMRVNQIVKWVASFYPAWDDELTNSLLDVLALPRKQKVKTLSKGQNSRLALLLALGHRPQLVILDDPTLGLDPIARKDFLRHVIDLLQSNNVTVFFSSHLLYEIEPVADHVAILDSGRIVKSGPTESLRDTVRRFILTPKPDADYRQLPGILDLARAGDSISLTVEDCDDARRTSLQQMSRNGLQESTLNLDEIFEAYVIGNRGRQDEPAAVLTAAQPEDDAHD